MSVKILQSESKVVPISSKFCNKCFKNYNDKYSGKPGERLLVIVPKPKPITSPFAPEETQKSQNIEVPMNIKSRGVLATSEPPKPPEEITIKTELVIENDFGNNNKKTTEETDKGTFINHVVQKYLKSGRKVVEKWPKSGQKGA